MVKPQATMLDPNRHPVPSDNAVQTITSVGAVAVALPATPKPGKLSTEFLNYGTASIFIGPANTVTTTGATKGREVGAGEAWAVACSDSVTWFGIRAGGAEDCLTTEI